MMNQYYKALRLWRHHHHHQHPSLLLLRQRISSSATATATTINNIVNAGSGSSSTAASSSRNFSSMINNSPYATTSITAHPVLDSSSSSSSSNRIYFSTASSSSSSFSLASLSQYLLPLREPEKGTGFDNFLKRKTSNNNNKDKDKKSSHNKKEKEGDDDNKYSSSGSGGGGGGQGEGGGGKDNNNGLLILATMILATFMIMSSGSNDDEITSHSSHTTGSGSGSGSILPQTQQHNNNNNNLDLSWSEFLYLLEHNAIFKIVIHQGPSGNISRSNNQDGSGSTSSDGGTSSSSHRARVYLKPGTQQLLLHRQQQQQYNHSNGNSNHDDNWNTSANHNTTTSNNHNGMHDSTTTTTSEWSNTSTGGGEGSSDDYHHDSSSSSSSSSSVASMSNSTSTATKTPLVYRNLRIGSASSLERKLEEAQRALGRSPRDDVPVQYQVDSSITHELLSVLPWFLLSAFLIASFRGAAGRMGGVGATGSSGSGPGGSGGMFGMGKSTAQKYTKETGLNIGFKDVAGCDEAKREIMEFVEFLQTPDRFTNLGAKIPKGALLAGPPGTGKTLLAKAVAGEAGVPFYSLAGSEFLEMFVGVGPSRVRDLFREARENAPCIIFIDEIDSIGRKRGKSSAMGGNDERENTLNQLLVEMDGFDPSVGVICLAGTNRDDILDPALTRPGRFDRKIQVDLPDIQGRKEIFKVHLRNITLVDGLGPANGMSSNNDTDGDKKKNDDEKKEDEDIPLTPEHQAAIDNVSSRLAGLTPGFSGADIANICNEAAIVAARRNADSVTMEDFEKATDRVIGGLESNKLMSPEERKIVAYHEAGHAVAGWFLEHADLLLKVTIIPRASGALGFAQYLPKEVHLRTQDQIMDIVAMALAGRAAEEVFFGSVTTGASDDLRRVTQMVYSTIQLYGMNSRLGQLAFPKDPSAMWEERRYSEKTAKAMDEEAKEIVDMAYKRTVELIKERKDEVDKVANLLLEKETINHDQIYDIIGERPYKGDKNYEEYVSRRQADRKEKEAKHEKDTTSPDEDGNTTDDANAPNLNPSL